MVNPLSLFMKVPENFVFMKVPLLQFHNKEKIRVFVSQFSFQAFKDNCTEFA